ncbi:MAG: DUF86 domain-containing protein [Burkholderiales bacterium]|nr:DUF86 domain-containing protein [Burkholderiales bacterium]
MNRRDPLRVRDYLSHILQAIANIREYTAGMDRASYLGDRKTQDAVVRNFEVIGEACNKVMTLHPAFATAHPDVRWTTAYEMRNALAHGYFKVDQQIVWTTIQDDLPVLEAAVKSAVQSAPM